MGDVFVGAGRKVRLRLPEGWEAATQRSSTALFASYGGRGAVNVSVIRARRGVAVNAKDVLLLLARAGSPVDMRGPRTLSGGETVFEVEYEVGATAWRAWCVQRGSTVAILTYNCGVSHKGAEDAVVMRIVDSVRIED
jgi:hypothetical protein